MSCGKAKQGLCVSCCIYIITLIALFQTVELMRDILPQFSIEVNDTLPFEKDPENAIEQAKVRPVASSLRDSAEQGQRIIRVIAEQRRTVRHC